jgi:hypothetical protein
LPLLALLVPFETFDICHFVILGPTNKKLLNSKGFSSLEINFKLQEWLFIVGVCGKSCLLMP